MARRSSISDEILNYIHENKVNIKDRIIYTGAYYQNEEWYLDYKQALIFVQNLDYLNSLSSDQITIKMFTPGGCLYAGMMMYDAIKNSTSETIIHCYGITASMGTIVAQAVGQRYISKNCPFMVHRISFGDEGDLLKMRSGIEYIEVQMNDIYDIYVDRCKESQFAIDKGYDEKKIRKFLIDKLEKKVDWWMSPEEAVYYGFMDGIL